MITGEYAVIRAADGDDAPVLKALYDAPGPRCACLDSRRESIWPTTDELRELLGQKEMGRPLLYAVEDGAGMVRGFCSVRSLNLDVNYAELLIMLRDEADFGAPLASEAFDFLARQAFQQFRLNKLIAHALDCETAQRDFLLRHGFMSNGAQREAVFAAGGWHNIETFSLFRSVTAYAEPSLVLEETEEPVCL